MYKGILYLVPLSILVAWGGQMIIPILLASFVASLFVFGMFPKRVQDEICEKNHFLATLMHHRVTEDAVVVEEAPKVETPDVQVKVIMPKPTYQPRDNFPPIQKERKKRRAPIKEVRAEDSSPVNYVSDL
jgi:hypothetical protein